MSVHVLVFIERSRLPTTAQWQSALDRFGTGLKLDAGLASDAHSGYWPATIDGHQSGFEYYLGSTEEAYGGDAPAELGRRDLAVDLVTHSDLRELRCSMMAAAALAHVADGLAFDESTGGLVVGTALLEQALAIGDT